MEFEQKFVAQAKFEPGTIPLPSVHAFSYRRIPCPRHEVSRDWLGSFQGIDGPSWPYDGPVWEEISAKGILGFVILPYH